MPLHFVYDAGLLPTTITSHDRLSFAFPVDLAGVAARSTTGSETGHVSHGFAVHEVVVSFDVLVRGSKTYSSHIRLTVRMLQLLRKLGRLRNLVWRCMKDSRCGSTSCPNFARL